MRGSQGAETRAGPRDSFQGCPSESFVSFFAVNCLISNVKYCGIRIVDCNYSLSDHRLYSVGFGYGF